MKHERKKTFNAPLHWLLCALILMLAAGCASPLRQPLADPPPQVLLPQPEGQGWWFIRFRMARPDDATHWEKDLLIAHRIAAPILGFHQTDIGLWRFHRRSAEDDAGHQFSLLFYTSAAAADRINQAVMDQPLVKQLLAAGEIQNVLTDAVDHNDRPNVGDTSDPNWSPVMQHTWPHYIMGVSRMWLEMIDQLSRATDLAEDPTVEQLLKHYETVNIEVTRIWQREGYHALLHHLNAIYGYKALEYWEKRWKAF